MNLFAKLLFHKEDICKQWNSSVFFFSVCGRKQKNVFPQRSFAAELCFGIRFEGELTKQGQRPWRLSWSCHVNNTIVGMAWWCPQGRRRQQQRRQWLRWAALHTARSLKISFYNEDVLNFSPCFLFHVSFENRLQKRLLSFSDCIKSNEMVTFFFDSPVHFFPVIVHKPGHLSVVHYCARQFVVVPDNAPFPCRSRAAMPIVFYRQYSWWIVTWKRKPSSLWCFLANQEHALEEDSWSSCVYTQLHHRIDQSGFGR